MNLKEMTQIVSVLLISSVLGYIMTVLKEKLNIRSNTIVIDKKNITQEQIDEADVKTFLVDGEWVRAGDEVKLFLRGKERKRLEGIVLGAKKKEDEIVIFTYKDELEKCKVENIRRVKIVSKYGMFFKFF